MSMTPIQAQRLGAYIAKTRAKRGLSLRDLAEKTAIQHSWLGFLEQGRYSDPAPDRLARLCDALDIAPGSIDRLTKGAVSDGLPSGRTYFRAKYDLSADQVEKVERYIARLQRDEP